MCHVGYLWIWQQFRKWIRQDNKIVKNAFQWNAYRPFVDRIPWVGVCLGVSLPRDVSARGCLPHPFPIACWDTPPPPDRRNDTRLWKHYLDPNLFAGGKYHWQYYNRVWSYLLSSGRRWSLRNRHFPGAGIDHRLLGLIANHTLYGAMSRKRQWDRLGFYVQWLLRNNYRGPWLAK